MNHCTVLPLTENIRGESYSMWLQLNRSKARGLSLDPKISDPRITIQLHWWARPTATEQR